MRDESIYSILSRYHRRSGNGSTHATCVQLFGSTAHSSRHDFPNQISVLADRTSGHYGSASQIIMERTIYPVFRPFRSPTTHASAWQAMMATSPSPVAQILHLPSSGVPATHPLKICSCCLQLCQQEYGLGYWRREHQLPGVWVCAEHGEPLRTSTACPGHGRDFQWILPSCTTVKSANDFALWPDKLRLLGNIQEKTCGATDLGESEFLVPELLSRTYRNRARGLGFVTPRGAVDFFAAERIFVATYKPLHDVPDVGPALPASGSSGAWMRRLCSSGLRVHPIRHLLIMAWMFESWSDFLHAYGAAACEHQEIPPLDSVASKTAIRDGLRNGESIAAVAHKAHASRQTARRELRRDSALQCHWASLRYTKRRDAARSQWLAVREDFPGWRQANLRMVEPSAYDWLYRNDRDWLRALETTQASRNAHACTDDEVLADAVRASLASLEALTKTQLSRHLRAVVKELSQGTAINSLPRVQSAIMDAVSRHRRRRKVGS